MRKYIKAYSPNTTWVYKGDYINYNVGVGMTRFAPVAEPNLLDASCEEAIQYMQQQGFGPNYIYDSLLDSENPNFPTIAAAVVQELSGDTIPYDRLSTTVAKTLHNMDIPTLAGHYVAVNQHLFGNSLDEATREVIERLEAATVQELSVAEPAYR